MEESPYDELYAKVASFLENEDWESAYEMLKNKELEGDANAIAILGEFYIYEIGVAEDVDRGIEMFKKAIELGCSEATNKLATLYLDGDKVQQNETLAFEYIKQGAEMGNALAMGKMATLYYYDKYEDKNLQQSIEWAQKAAKLGDYRGYEFLGVIHDDGNGVARDPKQAAYYYREALLREPNNTPIMYRLAVCLTDPFEEFGLYPNYKELEEAYSWTCKGVEEGDLDCHMLIAWFYEMGNVVSQDLEMAHKYLKIAADHGHEISARLITRYRKNIFGKYYLIQ